MPLSLALHRSLSQPDTLQKLVKYVTEMPASSDSEARRYKYPFVSSEVLSCDIPAVRDAIFEGRQHLTQLLTLLQQPPPLPPVLAGYVAKVITALQKSSADAFKQYFDDADGISVEVLLPQLVKHIGSDSILQLLINLCIGEPPASEPGGPTSVAASREDLAASSWLPHSMLLPATLDALGAAGDDGAEAAANASAFLCALLAASTEPPACLEDGEAGAARCASLVRVCLGDDISEPPNLPALEVVLQLLGKLRDMPLPPPGQPATPSPCFASLLDAIELEIERFFAALAAPTPLPNRIARFLPADGLAYRPRGQQRCKLLLLMEECLKSERPNLVNPLIELGLFHIVTDLLLLPHTCNALHMRASAIIEWAISTNCELCNAIHQSLLTEAMLTQRLLALVAEYTPPPPPPPSDGPPPPPIKRKTLPCCHAFVMHIGACLLSAAQREPDVRGLLESSEGWEAFIAPGGALTTWEATQSKPLGGLAPTRTSDNESDDDDEIDATTMERVLAAQAAAQRGGAGDDRIQDGDDDEDDEGGHSSEYLQDFAQYLSNTNFLNQTSDNVHDFGANASNNAWNAEFDDFDVEGSSGGPSAGGGTASADEVEEDINTSPSSGQQMFGNFDAINVSSGPADGNMDSGGWAAFEPAGTTDAAPAAEDASSPATEAADSGPN